MTMRNKEAIAPRPEATPLLWEELTAEQSSAGRRTVELIRGMASSKYEPLPAAPQEHDYVPLIDKHRSSRVILLDGARGSGKSALLVTIVDFYVRTLTGQRLNDGYEQWLHPEAKVVPVGLIDLQPLPGSPHLMLYLLSNLERVVRAMEPQEIRHAPNAPWHVSSRDELKSRTLWRSFARAAAMGWNGNLAERKGQLDPEAFAIELQDGELLRLDVVTVFRQFVDALVDDYKRWRGWDRSTDPLFMIAIDDADMNAKLSGRLLELLRTLWHPRLVFVLTGDTQLFLNIALDSENGAEDALKQLFQMIPETASREDDVRRMRELRADVYGKIIPQRHRCELRPLSVQERLLAGPRLGENLFRKIEVQKKKFGSKKTKMTVEDCFNEDPQTVEALPDRLRHLYELDALIRQENGWHEDARSKLPVSASQSAVQIWDWVTSRLHSTGQQWKPLVRLNGPDSLKVSGEIVLRPVRTIVQEIEFASGWVLHVGYPSRFEPPTPPKSSELDAMQAVAAALMLATDLACVTEGSGFLHRTPAPSGLNEMPFSHVSWESDGGNVIAIFPWPVPDWDSFTEVYQLTESWKAALASIRSLGKHSIDEAAKAFLRSVILVGSEEPDNAKLRANVERQDSDGWATLARDIAQAARKSNGRRQRVLAEWSLERAGLMCAPESGLSPEVANRFIIMLRNELGDGWEHAQAKLRETRSARVTRMNDNDPEYLGVVAESSSKFLGRIDAQFERHRFAEMLSDRAGNVRGEFSKNFYQALNAIRPKWLGQAKVPNAHEGLTLYLSAMRKRWLERGSPKILNAMAKVDYSSDRIRGIDGKLLERIWKAAVSIVGEVRLADVVLAKGSGIEIRKDYERRSKVRLDSGSREQDPSFSLQTKHGLVVDAWAVGGSANFIVDSKLESEADAGVIEAAFRIAFDTAMDMRGLEGVKLEYPRRWWAGTTAKVKGRPVRLWPIPAWQTLREQEEIEVDWNERVRSVKEVSDDEEGGDRRGIDALAAWFIRECDVLTRWYRGGAPIDFDIEPAQWGSLTTQNSQGMTHAERTTLMVEWSADLLLLAAPESGLSDEASLSILAAVNSLETWRPSWVKYQNHLREHGVVDVAASSNNAAMLHLRWNRISRSRMLRLKDAGFDHGEIDRILSGIDADFGLHPWVQFFGNWSDSVKPWALER